MKPRADAARPVLFYDGDCGFCHAAVTFILRHEAQPRFGFAPIQGRTITERLSESQRAALPDSLVVLTPKGKLLLRSDAVIAIARTLRAPWRQLGAALRFVPRPLRDLGYRAVARVRRRLAPAPKTLCPIVPKHLRARFLP